MDKIDNEENKDIIIDLLEDENYEINQEGDPFDFEWEELDEEGWAALGVEEEIEYERIGGNKDLPAFIQESFKNDMIDYNSPISIFTFIFDEKFFDMLADSTNNNFQKYISQESKYISKRIKQWEECNTYKIKKYIAILLLMGIVRLPDMKGHWKKNVFYQTFIPKIMGNNEFELIHRFFHLPEENNPRNKLNLISLTLEYLQNKWNNLYKPLQSLTLDETIIPFKGRTYLKQYEPKKPYKWGIKAFALAEAISGYMLKFKIYEGKNTIKAKDAVINLLQDFRNKNHLVYFDSYYSSTSLLIKLAKKNIWGTCTIIENRKGLPRHEYISNKNMNDGDTQEFHYNKQLLNLRWKDKKVVNIITTVHSNLSTKIKTKYDTKLKPIAIQEYNSNYHGVDKNNQYCQYYSFDHRVNKWSFSVFIRLLEISIVNSYIVYMKTNKNPISHKDFRLSLISELLEIAKYNKKPKKKYNIVHEIEKMKERRNCKYCNKNGIRTSVSFYCKTCFLICKVVIPLCNGICFLGYHK